MARRRVGDRDIGFALDQRLHQIVMMMRMHLEGHARPFAAELGHRLRYDVERQAGHDAEPDMPAARLRQIARRMLERGDAVENIARLVHERMRLVGRDEAAAGELEQRKAQAVLGMAQRLRYRRLRHAKRARGGADRPVRIDGVKDFDLAKAHAATVLPQKLGSSALYAHARCAIASTSMRAPSASSAETTVERAGKGAPKWRR